jgi:CsoR family transcriptional regulator, copper-sensing transcriptional repressor
VVMPVVPAAMAVVRVSRAAAVMGVVIHSGSFGRAAYMPRHGVCFRYIYPRGVRYKIMRTDTKQSCGDRLKRIEGQVRGIARMIEEDRYCIDVLTQIRAVRAALRGVEDEVLKDHVEHCVEGAIASGDGAEQRQKVKELLTVLTQRDW